MKKSVLLFGCLLLGFSLFAQVTLTFDKHALISGETNEMVLVEFVESGNSGTNQVWDFSGLEIKADFEGVINQTSKSIYQNEFEHSNSILEEFGNQFFFNVQNDRIESYGMVSASGRTVVKYIEPYIKMKYPFGYGNEFSGTFSGNYGTDQKVLGDIDGKYIVTADAYGRLILPGNTYENTLRVKSYREIIRKSEKYSYTIIHETYRWYLTNHRFPVLVLSTTSIINSKRTSTSHQAALNANVSNLTSVDLVGEIDFSIYPNPVTDELVINYNVTENSNVKFVLYDLGGRVVDLLLNETKSAGNYNLIYNIKKDTKSGNYILHAQFGEQQWSKKIVISK